VRHKEIIGIKENSRRLPVFLVEVIDRRKVEQVARRLIAGRLPHQADKSLGAVGKRQYFEVSHVPVCLKSHGTVVLDLRSPKEACLFGPGIVLKR
jgi:hypothetical protein